MTSLQTFLHLFPIQKHPELSGPLSEVLLERQFTSAALENTLAALLCHSPPSCISCTCVCLSSAKHNNGHPGGGDATFTSTETRWAAKKGSLADF